MTVWIDQDLCTGDGLCIDHCPEMFVLLKMESRMYATATRSARCRQLCLRPPRNERHVIDAAQDCSRECIFVENDREPYDEDIDIAATDIVDSEPGIR